MNPISFNLYNRDNQSCLYLESAPWPQSLFLEIENSSEQVLNFTQPSSGTEVGPDNYHFQLQFRPGVLDDSLLDKITLSDLYSMAWQFKVVKTDQRAPVSLYFLKIDPEQLTVQPNQKIHLLMQNIVPANRGGTRGSQVMLSYRNISFSNSPEPLSNSTTINFSLVNKRGGETSPLYAAFRGNNRIINDGDISNELTLVLTNTQLYNSLTLTSNNTQRPTSFKISFEVQEDTENQVWALGTDGEVKGIRITGEDEWTITESGSDAGSASLWEITTTKTELLPNEEVRFNITNIKSSLPSGVAYLSLKIENIPGFRDSYFKLPIEKIPVVARGHRVGIGTDEPQAKLHVTSLPDVDGLKVEGNTAIAGTLSLSNGEVGIDITNPDGNQLKVEGNTAIAGNLSVSNGNVGIGTTDPGANQLKVEGNTAIAGNLSVSNGNVGIGTTDPGANQLKVEGNTAIAGNLSVNGNSTKIGGNFASTTLRIEATDSTNKPATTAAIELHGYARRGKGLFLSDMDQPGKWFIGKGYGYDGIGVGYNKTSEKTEYKENAKFFINTNGNVGIGKTNPQATLDVNGDIRVSKKPIEFKKFSNIGDNTNYRTNYRTSEWICGVVGFISGAGDIHESITANIIRVHTQPGSDGWWYIQADFLTQNQGGENWTVWVIAIKKDISNYIG